MTTKNDGRPDLPRHEIDGRAQPGTLQTSLNPEDEKRIASDAGVARGLFTIPIGYTDRIVFYAVAWVSSAAAAGVIGNLAYFAIQQLLGKVKPKSHDLKRFEAAGWEARVEDVELVARLALQARCGELGMPIPKTDQLKILERACDSQISNVWHILIEGPSLRAEIVLATGGMWYQQIPITIWTVT